MSPKGSSLAQAALWRRRGLQIVCPRSSGARQRRRPHPHSRPRNCEQPSTIRREESLRVGPQPSGRRPGWRRWVSPAPGEERVAQPAWRHRAHRRRPRAEPQRRCREGFSRGLAQAGDGGAGGEQLRAERGGGGVHRAQFRGDHRTALRTADEARKGFGPEVLDLGLPRRGEEGAAHSIKAELTSPMPTRARTMGDRDGLRTGRGRGRDPRPDVE